VNGERREAFSVAINYSESLRQMIEAGSYDEVSKDISPRNFYLQSVGHRTVELTLIQFGGAMSPLEMIERMKEQGFRPATIEELLAIGREEPDLQRIIPIVALGSSRRVKDARWFPCLGGNQAKRMLSLTIVYRRWSIYHRFAFVWE